MRSLRALWTLMAKYIYDYLNDAFFIFYYSCGEEFKMQSAWKNIESWSQWDQWYKPYQRLLIGSVIILLQNHLHLVLMDCQYDLQNNKGSYRFRRRKNRTDVMTVSYYCKISFLLLGNIIKHFYQILYLFLYFNGILRQKLKTVEGK